jgi:hypothetical protein
MFNGLILLNADLVHNGGNSLRTENAQKVILQREIKS